MLGLQIAPPCHLIFKFIIVLLQNLNGLGIGHMPELRVQHMGKTFDQPLVHKLIKKCHLLRRILQNVADHILQHFLRNRHIVL